MTNDSFWLSFEDQFSSTENVLEISVVFTPPRALLRLSWYVTSFLPLQPQQPPAPLPPIQLDPTVLPVNTKTHFKFPSNPESNVQASISKPPPVSLPPPPPSPPQQHFPSAAPPSSSFSISGPVLSSPQTFGPVRPSSELHQTHPTPHAPSSSYGPPPPPPPPSPSYGVPEPEPEPEPEPHHGPSPPFEIHNPLPEPLHFASQPAAPPHGHVPFDAPFEYCEGEFTPLPSSSQHYGPPPPLSGGYHRPHLRKRSENPIRQFLGLIGLKVWAERLTLNVNYYISWIRHTYKRT